MENEPIKHLNVKSLILIAGELTVSGSLDKSDSAFQITNETKYKNLDSKHISINIDCYYDHDPEVTIIFERERGDE